MITISFNRKVIFDIIALSACHTIWGGEQTVNTEHNWWLRALTPLATVYNVCPAQVSPLPISVLRWTGVRGLWPGRGKVARVLLHLRLSLCSLLAHCSVFSLGSASLDSAAHSPAGRPGRLLTWRLVLGTGHLESEIIMSRIMPGVVWYRGLALNYAQHRVNIPQFLSYWT